MITSLVGVAGWWETRRGWEGACEQAVQTWRSLLGAVGAGLCPQGTGGF